MFPYYPFNTCGICSNAILLTPDIGYWCILAFSHNPSDLLLVSLILPIVSGFYFIDFHSDLHYFLSSAYLAFNLLSFLWLLKTEAELIDFEIFLVFNMAVYYYKFPPESCLGLPQILICCISIFIHFKILSNVFF